jgi:hypothetical protein
LNANLSDRHVSSNHSAVQVGTNGFFLRTAIIPFISGHVVTAFHTGSYTPLSFDPCTRAVLAASAGNGTERTVVAVIAPVLTAWARVDNRFWKRNRRFNWITNAHVTNVPETSNLSAVAVCTHRFVHRAAVICACDVPVVVDAGHTLRIVDIPGTGAVTAPVAVMVAKGTILAAFTAKNANGADVAILTPPFTKGA